MSFGNNLRIEKVTNCRKDISWPKLFEREKGMEFPAKYEPQVGLLWYKLQTVLTKARGSLDLWPCA